MCHAVMQSHTLDRVTLRSAICTILEIYFVVSRGTSIMAAHGPQGLCAYIRGFQMAKSRLYSCCHLPQAHSRRRQRRETSAWRPARSPDPASTAAPRASRRGSRSGPGTRAATRFRAARRRSLLRCLPGKSASPVRALPSNTHGNVSYGIQSTLFLSSNLLTFSLLYSIRPHTIGRQCSLQAKPTASQHP